MIDARNITFSVGNKVLLDDVSASFESGKLHLIVGPNGAGKSTLIKVLSRLLKPTRGDVEYDGSDIASASDASLAKRRAVLSQAIEIAFPLKVREVVMMGRYPHFGGRPGTVDEQITDTMMALFEVEEFAHRDYQTLSGGERQRVNFARVLGQLWQSHESEESRCLFLDEPLTFLDIKHQIEFMKKVREFTSSPNVVTVGVVHDLSLAARFADQIVVLNEGKVVAAGTPMQVLNEKLISDVFEVQPKILEIDGRMQILFG
jgi:iron complex transport system ATP-binding protein